MMSYLMPVPPMTHKDMEHTQYITMPHVIYVSWYIYIHSTIPYIPQVLEENWFEIQEFLQYSLPKSLARQGEVIVHRSMIVSLIRILLAIATYIRRRDEGL